MVAKHGAVRPLSEQSERVLEFLKNNPGLTKSEIAAALKVPAESIRCLLYRARKRGELTADNSLGKHNVRYTVGELKPRPELKKNQPIAQSRQRRSVQKALKQARRAALKIVQTKTWSPPQKKTVEVIYPPGYKYTVQNSTYEPLVKHAA